MKKNTLAKILTLTLAGGTAGLFTGCGTTAGYKQADKTGAGIAEYRDEVVNVQKAVTETLQSMEQVEVTANTDPRKAFDQFSKSLSALDAAAAKAATRGQEMKSKGEAYFLQWEQQLAQVKNPEIKQLAEQRKDKLSTAFQGIKKVAEPLRAQFDPWLSDLKDLQTYLNNDLTISGVDAARPQFAKAKADGAQVEKSMDELVAELNSIAAAITPARVPESQSK